MRRISLTVFLLLVCFTMSAQVYHVEDVVELKTDLSARTSPRKDAEGKDCALLKVSVPSVKGMQFSESVGDIQYLPGELDVYVPEGTVRVRYSFQGSGQEYTLDFSEYGIGIVGKSVYKVVLKPERAKVASTGSLSITANFDGSIVLIDGKPSGQIPVTVSGLSEGEHIISVPNTKGQTCPDRKVMIKSGELTKVALTLVEKEFMGLGLEVLDDYDGEGYISRYKTIKNNGKVGIVDLAGIELVPCEFDWIYPDTQGGEFFVVGIANEVGIVNRIGLYKPGQGLVTNYYRSIRTTHFAAPWFHARIIDSENKEKFGYIDNRGREIVPFIFDDGPQYAPEEEPYMIVASYKKGNDLYTGVYDGAGKEVVAPRPVRWQTDFVDGVSAGQYGRSGFDRYFIMDSRGKETILPEGFLIERSESFQQGLVPVRNEAGKWGYVDKNGKAVIPYRYDSAAEFNLGFAHVSLDGEGYYINTQGDLLAKESMVKGVVPDYLAITDGKALGLMNDKGTICIPVVNERIEVVSDYIAATTDGETSVYNLGADFLFSIPDYIEIDERSRDGVMMIIDWETRTYGFLNEKGEILGDCIYSLDPPPFDPDKFTGNTPDPTYEHYQMIKFPISEGMIMLVLGDRFGYMDTTGRVVIPATYSAAFPFENGVAYVRKADGEWIKIDKNNNRLVD